MNLIQDATGQNSNESTSGGTKNEDDLINSDRVYEKGKPNNFLMRDRESDDYDTENNISAEYG